MGRILAMDIGQKRIGLAVTDPLRLIASGLDTVPVNEIFKYLASYIEKVNIDLIVVGSPVQMNNQPSESVKYIEPVIKKLAKMFPEIPIKCFDERFTSKIAKQVIIESGIGKMARRNKAMVDKISAVIILQSFLEQSKILNK